jgi:hypothetical protein
MLPMWLPVVGQPQSDPLRRDVDDLDFAGAEIVAHPPEDQADDAVTQGCWYPG